MDSSNKFKNKLFPLIKVIPSKQNSEKVFFQTLLVGCLYQENLNFQMKKEVPVFVQEQGTFNKPHNSLSYLLSKTVKFEPITLRFMRAEKGRKSIEKNISEWSNLMPVFMIKAPIFSRQAFNIFQARSVLESTCYLF